MEARNGKPELVLRRRTGPLEKDRMRRTCLLGWNLLFAVVVSVWAVGVAGAAEAGGEEKGGVNIFNLQEWPLGVWTVVVFLVLVVVLRKYAWGPMLEGLQRREQNIRETVEETQRAREEAQRLRGELQAEMDRAAEKVREIMDQARRDAQHATDDMLGKARVEIQKERERLHRDIHMARDQALQEIWTQTAQLATLISAKAIRRQLNSEDHRRLVDEAITELRQAGKERQREVASVQ
jgi:F-type H+-transporting ATPase subunit b